MQDLGWSVRSITAHRVTSWEPSLSISFAFTVAKDQRYSASPTIAKIRAHSPDQSHHVTLETGVGAK
jgi:hypothetical protein